MTGDSGPDTAKVRNTAVCQCAASQSRLRVKQSTESTVKSLFFNYLHFHLVAYLSALLEKKIIIRSGVFSSQFVYTLEFCSTFFMPI